jgi:lipopolysaccharide heptosyltransferase II
MTQAAWSDARNVLCVRLDNLGDVLMTTPAMQALKRARPDRRLTLLAAGAGASLAGHLPDVDEVIVYNPPWHRHDHAATPQEDLAFVQALAGRGFDAAVIFTVYSQNPLPAALMCYWTGIPLRAAYCRENPYRLLTDWARETEPQQQVRHEAARQLDLVRSLGIEAPDVPMSFQLHAADRERAAAKLAKVGVVASTPFLLVHPGASAASRRYPPEHFASAADLLARRLDAPIVFCGAPSEAMLVQSIRHGMQAPSISVAGDLTLGELAAVIAMAKVVVCNNSGPAHIAAAVGTPVVDLYALTNPQHTPWMVPSRVLYHDVECRYCYKSACPQGHHRCLSLVDPEDVARAACELWEPATDAAALAQANPRAAAMPVPALSAAPRPPIALAGLAPIVPAAAINRPCIP